MLENIGIAKGPGNALCSMRVGSDRMQLSKNGRHIYFLLNGRAIMSSVSDKDLMDRGAPIIALIIKNLAKKAGIDQLRWLPNTDIKKDNKMIEDAMRAVTKNLIPLGISVLETVPDEVADQPCKEAHRKDLKGGLENYRYCLKDFENTVNNIRDFSGSLLRVHLARTMWGSKDMTALINENKETLEKAAEDFEKVAACFEQADNRIKWANSSFERKLANEQVKENVGKIIEDFSFIKSFMARLAQDLNPLYRIDEAFRTKVGYPATWFFSPTTFMNFTYEYDNLINNMIKSASIEAEIFEPLLVWKITGAF